MRRLLRFSVQIENRGLADFRPVVPRSEWIWHKCHKHYHSMETFSSYDVISKFHFNDDLSLELEVVAFLTYVSYLSYVASSLIPGTRNFSVQSFGLGVFTVH